MTSQQRLDRADSVYALMTRLPKLGGRPACADKDPELFFSPKPTDVEKAKRVCSRCPVQAECLRWALANGPVGVWGGQTEGERRMARKRGAA